MGAEHFFGGAGEGFLVGDGKEDFEGMKEQGSLRGTADRISIAYLIMNDYWWVEQYKFAKS
ncbi:MAG: hypothetical protein ACK5TN_00575 [Acidobacteriota bacterium]